MIANTIITYDVNRQQLCAALGISESTVRRLESIGLPFTPVGKQRHRYDVAECREWLRNNACLLGSTKTADATSRCSPKVVGYIDASRKVLRKVMRSA